MGGSLAVVPGRAKNGSCSLPEVMGEMNEPFIGIWAELRCSLPSALAGRLGVSRREGEMEVLPSRSPFLMRSLGGAASARWLCAPPCLSTNSRRPSNLCILRTLAFPASFFLV